MTKKTIILFLIVVILINVIYWISLTHILSEASGFKSKLIEGFLFNNREYSVINPINLLAITGIVLILIAISFIIILLNKKDRNFKEY